MITLTRQDKILTLSEQQFQNLRFLLQDGIFYKEEEQKVLNDRMNEILDVDNVTPEVESLSQKINELDFEITEDIKMLQELNNFQPIR